MDMKTETPETDQMKGFFYEGGGQETDVFALCERLEQQRDQARADFNAVAEEACQLQDALGCPCETEKAQEKAMERLRDLIAAEGQVGDLEAECTRLHGHWHNAEVKVNVAKSALTTAEAAIHAIGGWEGTLSEIRKALEIVSQREAAESADEKPDGQAENAGSDAPGVNEKP
jgi:hypothetical protein